MSPLDRPPLRSFKPRRRKVGATAQARYAELAPRWMIAETGPLLDLAAEFGRDAPCELEIGIGSGDALIAFARAVPEANVIGIDVHRPGLVCAVLTAADEPLPNVRVVDGDVLVFLHRVPRESLSAIRVWFPDPWPKARQRNRRLIRAEIVDEFVARLRRGGHLALATDWADYAEQMDSVCGAHPGLRGGRVSRPGHRPVTRFEQRGRDAQREIVDLRYVKE